MHMKIDRIQLSTIRAMLMLFLSAAPLAISAQGFSKKDLIGKWQSANAAKPMEIIFSDTITLSIKTDGNPALSNTTLTYSVDSIGKNTLLSIHFPTGFTMKMILWVKSKDEFRLFEVDLINYKDPLKEIPEEHDKKIIILKRSTNVI